VFPLEKGIVSGINKNYSIRNIFINVIKLTYLTMDVEVFFLLWNFKLSKLQTGNLQLLMQPVGAAVSFVCVRAILSSFNRQH